MLKFTNPATEAGYKALVEKDRRVHLQRRKDHPDYHGMLSGITPSMAETMISEGVNLVEKIEKNATNPVRTAPAKPAPDA